MTTPDPVTDVWELLFTTACDFYRDQDGSSEARLIDALMPIVRTYGDARAADELLLAREAMVPRWDVDATYSDLRARSDELNPRAEEAS